MNKTINLNNKFFLDENSIVDILKNENPKPTLILNNKNFNNITNFCSIGNYQYNVNEKVFLYRELDSILKIKKLSLDKFISLLEEKIYFYLKSKTYIEIKENKFYFYSKSNNSFLLRKVDSSLFDGYIKLFLIASGNIKDKRYGFSI